MNFEKEAEQKREIIKKCCWDLCANHPSGDPRNKDFFEADVVKVTALIQQAYERGRNDQVETDAKIAIDHQESGKYMSTCCLKRKCPETIAVAIREGRRGK